MPNILEAKELSFTYRGAREAALNSASFGAQQGEFVAVMGRAGSGKSTLCLALNGLIPRSVPGGFKGEVRIAGENIADLTIADIASRIGIVFQQFEAQLFATNVASEVAFGPENLGLPRQELRRRVEEYLTLLRLTSFRDREPSSLSGGEKQRLVIAAALSLEPEILVMDEPTTDLDSAGKTEVIHAARGHAGRNRTLVVVEHDTEVVAVADRTVLMNGGSVVASGHPREVFTDMTTMKACGVRPPQMIELFQKLGIADAPLTVSEARTVLPPRYLGVRSQKRAVEVVDRREPILRARELSFQYPGTARAAVDRVNVNIHAGEFVALIGSNGSGKTTLAKTLGGILKPVDGEVLFHGQPITSLSAAARAAQIGFAFQNPDDQLFASTVREELSFAPRNFGLAPKEVAARVDEALRITGLGGHAADDPFVLTKGQRQLLSVAIVLAMDPDIIILDEPTTGLDHAAQEMLMERLVHLRQSGRTIITVTHSMLAVAEYASRVIVMHRGRVAIEGHPGDVFREEETLAAIDLAPPPIVQLGNQLHIETLTVSGMASVLASIG